MLVFWPFPPISPEDWVKAVLSVLSTALGVLLGLLGNGYVIWRQERDAYRGMLRSVASEAASNMVVLEKSFMEYFESGIVLRGFSTTAAARCVSDPLFIRFVRPAALELLHAYLRALVLANSYGEKSVQLQTEGHRKSVEVWLDDLISAGRDNLKECRKLIRSVAAIGGTAGENGF